MKCLKVSVVLKPIYQELCLRFLFMNPMRPGAFLRQGHDSSRFAC